MNIDISNAHCGFRTLSVTHAWPRVARHSNPPGRRLTPADGRAWTRAAGGRALPSRGTARSIGGGVSSRFAKRNARRPRRRRSPRGFADPARRFHSSSSARTVVSSRAAAPRGRPAPSVAVRCRRRSPADHRTMSASPRAGLRSRRRELLACPRPASPSTGGAAAAAGESLARPRIR